ncbi:MAG: metallophosphoesterase [Candidatus Freyarchaeota archaeon]|nr:metallophosphoesterase [Candidatus Jordarchaeia archaeon]
MGGGSIIVISDCHLGLVAGGEKEKGIVCEPEKLGQFLSWLIRLKGGEKVSVKLGPWGGERKEKVLKPPEKVLLIGDILELWDASDRAIEYCSRPIFDLLEKLDCDKIYLLGNHDYDLKPLLGVYPSGEHTLSIIEDCYPVQEEEEGEKRKRSKVKRVVTLNKGDRGYLFVHGYQFDRIFRFQPWKLLPGIRSGALAFGRYGDLFVGLLVLGIVMALLNYGIFQYFPLGSVGLNQSLLGLVFPILQFLPLSFLGLSASFWNALLPIFGVLGNGALIFLWAILGGPRVFYLYGRKVWNGLVGTRYNRKASIRGLRDWWRRFSKNKVVETKNLRIVYGHTHLTDVILPDELVSFRGRGGEVSLTALNIPAWVKDYTEKHRQKLRATCLYIDDEDELFIGWDWNDRRPFLVPIETVYERMEKGVVSKDTGKKLLSIGWPKSMVELWTEEKVTF